jgi:hypothetical protein
MKEKWPKKVFYPKIIMGRKINPNSKLISENQVLAVDSLLNNAVAV